MSLDQTFTCHSCDQPHAGPPMSYFLPAPDQWSPELAANPKNVLEQELCIIEGQGYFVRGLIEIPVPARDDVFSWDVWVSLSRDNFMRTVDLWDEPGRENQPPSFGWLCNAISGYPSTLNLKTNVHARPVGQRPSIELEPTDHPLAVEQRTGITPARVREIAELALHPR
jgi:hypothetical protein